MFSSSRNPGGRPRKTADEKRSVKIGVRFRRDEFAAVQAIAAATNMTVSDYLRSAAVATVSMRTARRFSAIDRHDLARIGATLGQLARSNADASPALSELRALLRRLHELER